MLVVFNEVFIQYKGIIYFANFAWYTRYRHVSTTESLKTINNLLCRFFFVSQHM